MDAEASQGRRRRHYGIAEIAEALGVDRQLVTVWRRRLSRGLPPPDDELASGPLWLAETVEPWIVETRARLERQQPQSGRERAFTSAFVRQAARRFLRLVALLLEEPRRPRPIGQALRALENLGPRLEQAVEEAGSAEVALVDLSGLVRRVEGLAVATVGSSGSDANTEADPVLDDVLEQCLAILPNVTQAAKRAVLDTSSGVD